MAFDIHTDHRGDIVIITISGSVTIEREDALDTVLTIVESEHPQRVVLDLENLEFMSALALGGLMILRHTTTHRGGWVRVAGLQGKMLGRFHEHHLEAYFDLFDSVEDAVEGVSQYID